jgi:hypothetical protein
MKRSLVSDGTNAYVAVGSSIQKIVAATGVSTSIVNDDKFNSLTYGNSILYGANDNGIYSIHVTTGVRTKIVKMEGITSLMYFSTTNILALKGNSLVNVLLADGSYTYIKQDM